jgi:ubiquinone/menaquinone biosynthesis C-methylase UbiE
MGENIDVSRPADETDPFAEYYARESLSAGTIARFQATQDAILRVRRMLGLSTEQLDVADIGCGAATQCMMWAKLGHRVSGMDVNEPLIEIGRRRVADAKLPIDLQVGTATQLSWASGSMDVCLLPELLEHVVDWRRVLGEAARILRPNGILYISTTNRLCPLQSEFDLPLYSWYPGPLKRYCERLATTTHPQWVNHAQYPAVNWFDYYSLRGADELRGFTSMDRFDAVDLEGKSGVAKLALKLVRANSVLRFLAHVATSYTMMFAVRSA